MDLMNIQFEKDGNPASERPRVERNAP